MPERDHAAGKEVEARRHAVAPEQHDAEERRLEHEGGEGLVAEQRTLDRAGLLREPAPVGAELERHDDAGHDAHAEGDREDLDPEIEHAPVERVAGGQPRALDRRQPRGQPDREGREDDVKADDERELDARQEDGIEIHGYLTCAGSPPRGSRPGSELRANEGSREWASFQLSIKLTKERATLSDRPHSQNKMERSDSIVPVVAALLHLP